VAGAGFVPFRSGSSGGVSPDQLGGVKEAGSMGTRILDGVVVQVQGHLRGPPPPPAAAATALSGPDLYAAPLRNGYATGPFQPPLVSQPASLGCGISGDDKGGGSSRVPDFASGLAVAAAAADGAAGGTVASSTAGACPLVTAGSGGSSRSSGDGGAPGLPSPPQQEYAPQAGWSTAMMKKHPAAVYEAVKQHLVAHLQVGEWGRGKVTKGWGRGEGADGRGRGEGAE
jgi:hypothetical protein